jgi:hypothetical protein
MMIDQSAGASKTFGSLVGALNSVNTDYTVSYGSYVSGTLRVYLNGQLLIQGTDADWVELVPASGTFRMNVAPEATDIITAEYGYTAFGIVGPAGPAGPQGPNNVMHSQLIFTTEGAYLGAIWVGVHAMKLRMPYVGAGATIEEVYVQLGTAPGATSVKVNILRNGATILDVTPYVELGVGVTAVSRITQFIAGSWAKDDYLQWELVQGDSTAADLIIHVRYKWTMTTV